MDILPDVLEPGLTIVFCGTAAGTQSALAGAYYAGQGNRFWDILFKTGLTPVKLQSGEFRTLPEYGTGLTDLVKISSGADKNIPLSAYDIEGFCSRIRKYKPVVVAFNGKNAAKVFFGHTIDYGGPIYDERSGKTALFVLPSTSAAARAYWNEEYWWKLAEFIREHKNKNE